MPQKGCSLGTLESAVKWTQLTTLTLGGASGTAAQRQSDKQDSCRGENHSKEKAQIATSSNCENCSSWTKLAVFELNKVVQYHSSSRTMTDLSRKEWVRVAKGSTGSDCRALLPILFSMKHKLYTFPSSQRRTDAVAKKLSAPNAAQVSAVAVVNYRGSALLCCSAFLSEKSSWIYTYKYP